MEAPLQGLLSQLPQQACEHATELHHTLLIPSWTWRWCIIPNCQTVLIAGFFWVGGIFDPEPQSIGLTKNVWMSCLFILARGERIHLKDRSYLCLPLFWGAVIEENCLLAFGLPKNVKPNVHESLREDGGGGGDWQSQRKEGKYCVRVRCLTWGWALWPGTSWNGLGSLQTVRGGMERIDSKDGVWKKPGSVGLLPLTTQVSGALFESKKSAVWF